LNLKLVVRRRGKLNESFIKELSAGERKWFFIHIPVNHRGLFPKDKKFKVNFQGESFKVSISKAGRIVKEDLVKKLCKSHINTIIITKKKENEFEISALGENVRKMISP
jgi:hypothetical protein